MDEQKMYEAAYNVKEFGGSFAKRLDKLFLVADPTNRKKILNVKGYIY